MPTQNYEITTTYTELVISADTVYIQNKGSAKVELYVGNSMPSQDDEGVRITSDMHGVTVKLTNGESIYAKTESNYNLSTIVCVY